MSELPSKPLTPEQWAMVLANDGLIGFVLKGRRFSSAVSQDARDVAQDALIRAARSFDPSRGFKFSTYACRVIGFSLGGFKQSIVQRNANWKRFIELRDAAVAS